MNNQKSFCEIHHFYYIGNTCPLCQKEKYDRLSKKYSKEEEKEEFHDKELTEKDISKLSDKFNVIKKKSK